MFDSKRNKTNSNHLCKIIQTRCFSVFKIFKRYSLSSLCVRPGKLWAPFPPVINMRPGYMSLVEVRSHARPAICLKNGKPPLILASSLQPRERKPCQLSPECCSNADLTSMSPSRRKKVSLHEGFLFFFSVLSQRGPHSTGPLLLLALTLALLMCSHGSLAQFLKSCSMAMWRTCSSDASESFSCTATVSSSKTSVKGERERMSGFIHPQGQPMHKSIRDYWRSTEHR